MRRPLRDFYFRLDLRSLGLYRLFLASWLIWDWLARWPNLEAFYTSFGVLPVEAPLPKAGGEFHFCLLDGVTSLPMVRAVFCVGLVFYLLFLVGYRTRVFHGLSLLFFTSVLSRNVLIRDGSVMVTASLMLWALFLPLGRRFSVDAVLEQLHRGGLAGVRKPAGSASPPYRDGLAASCAPSLAALVMVAQIGLIYLFTAVAKNGVTWKDGTALYYALNVDQLARPLGQWLADQPLPLLKVFTWSVLGLEFAALPLMLLPVGQPWLRRVAIISLALMHLGIALTMRLGGFSAAMVASFGLLLTASDWEVLGRWWVKIQPGARTLLNGVRVRFAEWACALHPALGVSFNLQPRPNLETEAGSWLVAKQWAVNLTVGVLFLTFTLDAWNLNAAKRFGAVPEPAWMRAIVHVPLIQQDWELFAPDPMKDDGWWVIVGETESGQQVDPLTGQRPTFEKPADLANRFNGFWRKYLNRIRLKKNYDYRRYLGKYITRKNHREQPAGQRLARFDLYYIKENTLAPGTPQPWPTENLLLWHHECFAASGTPGSEP